MNVDILTGNMKRWTKELEGKEFQHFTQAEQVRMKEEYKLAEREAKAYGTGASITIAVKAFRERVADMEGFFFETVQ